MDKTILKNIEELNDKRDKEKIIKDSIKELDFSKKNWWAILMCIILSICFGFYISFIGNTILIMDKIVSVFLEVNLSLLATIMATYGIFQALMRDEIIRELIKDKGNILKKANRSFINLSVLFIANIFITVVLSIFLSMIDETFFCINILFSNILCFGFVAIYVAFELLLILEIINFAINMYRMFNIYDILRILDDDKS